MPSVGARPGRGLGRGVGVRVGGRDLRICASTVPQPGRA